MRTSGSFVKGKSGNPGGKPKNARNRITVRFLEELAEDFEEHGREVIDSVRMNDPASYLRLVAQLVPKEIEVKRPLEGLSDDELAEIAEELRSQIGIAGGGTGTDQPAQPETVN